MAKFNPASIISEISGSVGNQTYSRNAYGPYVKGKLTQTVRNTQYQQKMRQALADGVTAYRSLSDEDYKSWLAYVEQKLKSNGLSRKIKLDVFNEYVGRYINAAIIDTVITSITPGPFVTEFSRISSVSQSGTSLQIQVDTTNWTGSTNLAIYATAPLPTSVRAPSQSAYNLIGWSYLFSNSDIIDITDMYSNRYYQYQDGTPKRIFIAVKNINVDNLAASEKSYNQVVTDGTWPLPINPTYEAVINYAIANSITLPSQQIQYAQNALCQTLDDLGYLSACDLFYCFYTDNTPEFSKLNWINPGSFTLSEQGTPVFTQQKGWASDGTGYLKTGYNMSTDAVHLQQNAGAMSAWIEERNSAATKEFGAFQLGSGIWLIGSSSFAVSPQFQGVYGANTVAAYAAAWVPGLYSIIRTSSNQIRILRNTNQTQAPLAGSHALPSLEVYLCAYNNAGVAADQSLNVLSFFMASGNQYANLPAVYDAITTYKTRVY